MLRGDDEPVKPGLRRARLATSASQRVGLIGTSIADFIRASGHQRRVNRPDTGLHPDPAAPLSTCTAGAVHRTRRVQALQQHVMEAAPHARGLPIPQPPPATHAGATAHLGRQHLPRQARAQHEQDARQCGPVLDRRTSTLRTRPRRWQEWSDLIPEIIGEKRPGHAKPTLKTSLCAVSLGALSCLVAERCWDRVRWAIQEHAWRFDGLRRPYFSWRAR